MHLFSNCDSTRAQGCGGIWTEQVPPWSLWPVEGGYVGRLPGKKALICTSSTPWVLTEDMGYILLLNLDAAASWHSVQMDNEGGWKSFSHLKIKDSARLTFFNILITRCWIVVSLPASRKPEVDQNPDILWFIYGYKAQTEEFCYW